MPNQSQDQTLALSRDISALQRRCRAEALRLETDRRDALAELPGAAKALAAYDRELDKALVARENGLVKARTKQEEALRKARGARQRAFEQADRSFRDADPYPARRAAEREAERRYREAVEAIARTVASGQQPAERRVEHDRLHQAKRSAARQYDVAGRRALDRRRVTQRDALADERRAIRSAQDAFALASRAAERAHAAATRQATRRLRVALAGSEAAKPIEAAYRKRHRELETRCRAEEQRLLEAFRANRVGARAS